jgi:uncharacterized damage-inducible protein DinB
MYHTGRRGGGRGYTSACMELRGEFIAYSREKLMGQFWPRLQEIVGGLSDEQLWWRPNEASNSVGNLLLHLEGNARQWILSGVAGEPDRRVRALEFSRREPLPRSELLGRLGETLRRCDEVLARLDEKELERRRTIQGHEVSGLEAVYHVVEHFSTHFGQIAYVAKMLNGADLGFYRHLDQAGHGRKP